jgi:autotransporter-associated beta strand protein
MKDTNPHLTPLFGAPPSPLRHRARILLSAGAVLTLLFSTANSSLAGSATWKASPATGDWNTAGNWTPATIPNGSSDTATFAASAITGVSLSQFTQLDGVVFNAGASAFTIDTSAQGLDILGVGITNNSGIRQNFIISAEGSAEGFMFFFGHATAGTLTSFTTSGGSSGSVSAVSFSHKATAGSATFTNRGATATAAPGMTEFANNATAGNGTFNNNGGEVTGGTGGFVEFRRMTTAGNGTFSNNAGLVSGAGGGVTIFLDDSTGGKARVEVFGNGNLDISGHNAPGVTTGSIEGTGAVFLGANNLTVGSNNLSKIFSGVIQDGGNSGGTGGSLSKIGKGKLSLTNANAYTGGTTLNKGTLLVKNKTGSATGTGAVQVNGGTLGGTGIIAGAVAVGTGSSSGAFLSPGNSATSAGTLTINSALTVNSLSTYECVLNRSTPIAGKVTALGVTINSNVPFTFVDTGTGTLATGTVFTVINNTSASPITGTFSNLANGATFTSSGGTTFKASYTGGTGNDLTLTVQ